MKTALQIKKRSLFSLSCLGLCLLILCAGNPAWAHPQGSVGHPATFVSAPADLEEPETVFQLFQQTEVQEVILETDLQKLIDNKMTDDYQKAQIRFDDAQGQSFSRKIKIKVRGKSRRKLCAFPPIMLKFKKNDLLGMGLDSAYNKVKLVTHCMDDPEGEQYLLKEYLAYNLYNQLTERSLQVKLFRIRYVDSKGNQPDEIKYGFLIENHHEMAQRIQGKAFKQYGTTAKDYQAKAYAQMVLFQYMIGNTDWGAEIMRNIKLIRPNQQGQGIIPVPYDFDFSGLVNSNYAKPNPDFEELETVTQRRIMAQCSAEKDLLDAVALFNQRQRNLFQTVIGFELLPDKERGRVARYLGEFFKLINDPSFIQTELKKNCS